ADIEWNYRHTSFKDGELLLGATLRLTPDEPARIKERMDEAKSRRLETQPHGSRSAGCFFKNPPSSTIGTGKMIDEMGMKGTRKGSALVSPVHANFIVTEGENARADDALALAEEIRERVKREQGIELEYEGEIGHANEDTGNRSAVDQSQDQTTGDDSGKEQ